MIDATAALQTIQLRKSFGAFVVTGGVDFRLEQGARHALIGPNGAGKTTFINLVSGALPATSGTIALAGEDVTPLSQAKRVKRGLVRTFQINQLFRRLSVLENVTLAINEREGVAGHCFRPAGHHQGIADEAMTLIEGLGLGDDAVRPITDLAYGRQRMVEIAIALGLKPKVLLLDEPAAGVPTGETGKIVEVIERLPSAIAVLLVEHDMDLVFRLTNRITVLVEGKVLIEGTPTEIARDPTVREVYLGERTAA